jgi:hypothetical protein
MNEVARPMRHNRLIQIANLLAAHERATPLARRVLECRLCLVESELLPASRDAGATEVGSSLGLDQARSRQRGAV